METVEVELAGKTYKSAIPTQSESARLFGAIQATQLVPNEIGPMLALARNMAEILTETMGRAGETITAEEILRLAHLDRVPTTEEDNKTFTAGCWELARILKRVLGSSVLGTWPTRSGKAN